MDVSQCGVTKKDRLRNESVRGTTKMGEIPYKVQERTTKGRNRSPQLARNCTDGKYLQPTVNNNYR